MSILNYEEMTLESDTFQAARETFNLMMQKLFRKMEQSDMDEGSIDLKISIELNEDFVPQEDGTTVRIKKPLIKHKISTVVPVKDSADGKRDTGMCLVYDEKLKRYVLKYVSTGGQMNIFDMEQQAENDADIVDSETPAVEGQPTCLIGIFASDGGKQDREVARGTVQEWNPQEQSSSNTLKCVAYDSLYDLQRSQDNKFYSAGTGTKSIMTGAFDEWEIPTKGYSGPNVSHEKMKYSSSYVSDMLLDVLDDAYKKGGGKFIIRAAEGYADVVERGTNTDVYVFRVDNTKSISQSISTASLVTRVKVLGQADDDGNSPVEATVDGLTKYGIRQRIYTRGKDESLDEAKTAAQKIIDEDGVIDEEITVQAPDVPFIRKGDLVYVMIGSAQNYYYVVGIRHDCDNYSMTMDLELAKTETATQTTKKKDYNVGDIVNFKGGTHYVSSYSGSRGYSARAGKAKITIKNGSGKTHPWHLIHTDSGSNVYGWVDDGTFE